MGHQTMKSQVEELLAEWPKEWKRERLNILVRKAHRVRDNDPAVTVALRYKYTEVAATSAPLLERWDDATPNRVGGQGERGCYAAQSAVDAIIGEAEQALGQKMAVQVNCPESIIN